MGLDPLTAGAQLLSGAFSLFGKKKKAKEQDAYKQKVGQANAAQANAATAYNTRIKGDLDKRDTQSANARTNLKRSLLSTVLPSTIDKDAAEAAFASDIQSPIDYATGAPQAQYIEAPSESTGMIWDALSGVLGAGAQNRADQAQYDDYTKAFQTAQNGGIDPVLKTSRKKYDFNWL